MDTQSESHATELHKYIPPCGQCYQRNRSYSVSAMTTGQQLALSILVMFIATVFQLYHDGDMMYKEKARAYTFTDSMDL